MEWKNFDTLTTCAKLEELKGSVDIKEAMAGENGAKRVKEYCIPMSNGLVYNFASKQVDDKILDVLQELADESALTEKYAALYNGDIINTGEKRLVLHQLARGQLGEDVVVDGVNKREFFAEQQRRYSEFANNSSSILCKFWLSKCKYLY